MKSKERKDKITELWDNYKRYNIPVMGTPEGEGREETFETIITENFP